jgi:signal peptidase I
LAAVGFTVASALAGSFGGYWVACLALVAARVAGIVFCARSESAAKPGRIELGVVLVVVAIGLEVGRQHLDTQVVTVVRVPADSMYPTISAGDHVVVDETARPLRHGATVALRVDDSGTVLVKRIVAVAGDTITMQRDDVLLNGTKLAHTPLGARCRDSLGCDLVEESNGDARYAIVLTRNIGVGTSPLVTVPRDHVYVLNDNRSFGADSRVFGPVPIQNLVGHFQFTYLATGPD